MTSALALRWALTRHARALGVGLAVVGGVLAWALPPAGTEGRVTLGLVVAVTGAVATVLAGAVAPQVGVLWLVAGVGAAAQTRFPGTSVQNLTWWFVVGAVAFGLARVAVDRSAHLASSPVAARRLGLGMLAVALVLRLLPVAFGNVANGELPLGETRSLQAGEFSRPLLLAGAGLLLWHLGRALAAETWGPVERRTAIAGGSLVGLHLALLVVVDTGPAVLTLVGLAAMAVLVFERLDLGRWVRRVTRRRDPRLLAAAGALLAILGFGVVFAIQAGAWARAVERIGNVTDPALVPLMAQVAARSGGAIGRGFGSAPLVGVLQDVGTTANTDYLTAVVAADLGLLPLALLVGALLIALGQILSAVLARREPAAIATAGPLVTMIVQVAITAFGPLGVLPLTGLSTPFLTMTGSTFVPSAAVVGAAAGVLAARARAADRPGAGVEAWSAGPAPRAPHAVVAVAAGFLAAALALASVAYDRSAMSIWLARGDVATRDGQVIATSPGGDPNERAYPFGALYADLGALVPRFSAWGVEDESTGLPILTCGGGVSVLDWIGQILRPAPCRPADLVTTLDSTVQTALAEAIGVHRGSGVVLDAATGEVLALYSSGQLNPDALTDESPELADSSPRAPSRLAEIAPGPTFAPVVAAAALLAGADPSGAPLDVLVTDGESLSNAGGATCPDTAITTALAQNCATTAGYLAVGVGAPALGDAAGTHFGADRDLPFDAGDVTPLRTGLTPTTAPADLMRTGAGQQDVRTSPLALATATAALAAAAAGDDPLAPHALAGVCRRTGGSGEPRLLRRSPVLGEALPAEVAAEVLAGLDEAAERGTTRALGAVAGSLGRQVAASAGTARVPESDSTTGAARWVTGVLDGRWVFTVVVLDVDAEIASPAIAAAARLLPALPDEPSAAVCPVGPHAEGT